MIEIKIILLIFIVSADYRTAKVEEIKEICKIENLGRFVLERLNVCVGGIITGV